MACCGSCARPHAHGRDERAPPPKMDVPATGGSTADLIVPPKALEQIRRLYPAMPNRAGQERNHIGFAPADAGLFAPDRRPYPNYEQVIRARTQAGDGRQAGHGCRAQAHEASLQVTRHNRIRLAFSGGV